MIELIEKLEAMGRRFGITSLKRLKYFSTAMPGISIGIALILACCAGYLRSLNVKFLIIVIVILYLLIIFFGILFLITLHLYLTLRDLESLFSKSIYDGILEKPSLDSIFFQFSAFLITYATFGEILSWILPRIFPSIRSCGVKYSMAGRVFTYVSSSTVVHTIIMLLVFFILFEDSSLVSEGLLPAIGASLVVIFFFILTIVFFTVREHIFEYFSCKLISSEKERLKKENKALVERVNKRLDACTSGTRANDYMLSREVQALEKRVTSINEEVEEIEKRYKFHRSLKLTTAISLILIMGSILFCRVVE